MDPMLLAPPRRHVAPVVIGGAVVTFGVFAFLAWLQPALGGGERVKAPRLVGAIKVSEPKKPIARKRQQTERQAQRKRKARPQPKRRATARTQQRQVRRQTFDKPNISAGGGGFALSAALDAGANLSFDIADTAVGFAEQAMSYAGYQSERDRIRQGGRAGRGSSGRGPGGIAAPILKRQPKPRYPKAALNEGFGGRVKVRVLISILGKVEQHEVVAAQPAGYFEQAIIDVLPRWQLPVARDEEGRPIEQWQEFTYVFKLTDA